MVPFWNKKWGRNSICPITQTRLRPGRDKNGVSYTKQLKCGHLFWRKPLLKWLETNNSCPVCRRL